MHIQPAFNSGPSAAAQGVNFPTSSGGDSPGAAEGMRADWNVRINISHDTGFVGGAGRLLVHNQVADERRELVLLLPAARSDRPGQLELATATVCSAKPGISAAQGQSLAVRPEGPAVYVSIPVLQLNDWVYIDLTWTGGFPKHGEAWPGGLVPIGDFHPQVAVETVTDTGQRALAPVAARYDVEVGSDLGAKVRLEHDVHGGVTSRASDDGAMTMHDFRAYGAARIEATLAPPGSLG